MSQATYTRIVLATPLITVLAACGGASETSKEGGSASGSDKDVPSEIAARQANFEAIGDSFKAIRTQLESDEPDLSIIAAEASRMTAKGEAQGNLFPAGTSVDDGFETEALAVIWEEQDDFIQKSKDFGAATAKMVDLANNGDAEAVAAHVADLGGTCKACHEKFRVKKD
ncbi:MAG: cytochrome c [Erythrobacter sp.]